MLDWFDYHGHMCIAFEMLGLSVFDFLVSFRNFLNCILAFQFLQLSNRIGSNLMKHRRTTTTSRTRWIRCVTLATSCRTPFDSCTTTSWPTRTWSPKTFSLSTRTLTSPTTPKRWSMRISLISLSNNWRRVTDRTFLIERDGISFYCEK